MPHAEAPKDSWSRLKNATDTMETASDTAAARSRRRPRHRRALCVWTLLIAGGALASNPDEPHPIRAAAERAGVERHVAEWPELTLVARDRARAELDTDSFRQLEELVASVYAEARLRDALVEGMRLGGDTARANRFLAWYDTPLGRNLVADARRSGTPEDLRVQPLFVAEFMRDPSSRARREVLVRLDTAMHLSENVMRVALAISTGIATGALALDCVPAAEWPLRVTSTAAEVERRRAAATGRVRFGLEFTYRTRSTAELARYARFAESDDARWLHEAVRAQLQKVLREASTGLHQRIAPMISSRCAGPPEGGNGGDPRARKTSSDVDD
jgi:hypothetical protein